MPLKKINFVVGVTGSGKSLAVNMRLYDDITDMPDGSTVLFTGNTSESLYKNVVKDMIEMDKGAGLLDYTRHPGMIRTSNGAEVYCVGINNEGADKRIQGGNVELWYGDEATTYPRSSFDMCLSRCRGLDGAGRLVTKPAIFTLNPDDDTHFIKTDFIDRREDMDMAYIVFDFEDNPAATPEFVDDMRQRYTGTFYERMILGKWCGNSETKVIPEFNDEKEKAIVKEWPRPRYYDWTASLDPGYADHTGYLVGYYDFKAGRHVIEGEAWFNRANTVEIAERIKALDKEIYGAVPPVLRVSDTELQVIADLYTLHGLPFSATRKDDKEAQINNLRVLIQQEKIIIHPRCVNLRRQLRSAQWNKQRTQYERTDKEGHFDLIDSLVYFIRNVDRYKNPYPAIDLLDFPADKRDDIVILRKPKSQASALGAIMGGK